MIDQTREIALSKYCTQTFTVLDKWLVQVSLEKGEQALEEVKRKMQNNMNANVTYYEGLAKDFASNGQKELAAKNELLAKLYKGLLD